MFTISNAARSTHIPLVSDTFTFSNSVQVRRLGNSCLLSVFLINNLLPSPMNATQGDGFTMLFWFVCKYTSLANTWRVCFWTRSKGGALITNGSGEATQNVVALAHWLQLFVFPLLRNWCSCVFPLVNAQSVIHWRLSWLSGVCSGWKGLLFLR